MHKSLISSFCFIFVLCLFAACANIIPPTGGKNDTTPPKLLSIKPQDSLLNTRITRIDMKFDEFVTVNDPDRELVISPILSQNPIMTVSGKTVSLKIPDSLLQENTTYTINFGNAIKDLHESNPYTGKTFLFSTGPWFDSLHLKGKIIDAASGQLDSSATVKVLLYDAKLPFDIVAKQKPSYIATTNSKGEFVLNGLPNRRFRIFALKEAADNLKFDNDDESVAFADTTFNPEMDTLPIVLSIFKEIPDTGSRKSDTGTSYSSGIRKKARFAEAQAEEKNREINLDAKTFNYVVLVDTNNISKRTQDITKPLEIILSRKLDTFDIQKIVMTIDSSGIEVENKINVAIDTSRKKMILTLMWKENTLYTLRLLKGFATDTSKEIVMPSKYVFRSKSDDDYGKMDINLPGKYLNRNYLLQVKKETEVVYSEVISSSKTMLKHLTPGIYNIFLIEDVDGDGEWTTGQLKSKLHAEGVIPYHSPINMKAGWEHVINFEAEKKDSPTKTSTGN
jgi:hypothetical protein